MGFLGFGRSRRDEEIRVLREALYEQGIRLAALEAAMSSLAAGGHQQAPKGPAIAHSDTRAASEHPSQAAPTRESEQRRLPASKLAPIKTLLLDGGQETVALAISTSLLHLPARPDGLPVPRYVCIAGSNGSLLVTDANGKLMAPALQLPGAAAALAFSATEPARLWAATPVDGDSFFLHTYLLHGTRTSASFQDGKLGASSIEIKEEHAARMWWNADPSSPSTEDLRVNARQKGTDDGVPKILAIVPSFAPSSGKRPRDRERGVRSSVMVARSDGHVALASVSDGATVASLPTGLTSLRAITRSPHSLALASSERVLVLDLGQPGSPASARECELPPPAVGRISDVAFDAAFPALLYASTTDGDVLFFHTRARSPNRNSGRTPQYGCAWTDTRYQVAPPVEATLRPRAPQESLSESPQEGSVHRKTKAPDRRLASPLSSTHTQISMPEVVLASLHGYLVLARAGRLSVLNVSDVYERGESSTAPIVHDEVSAY